MFMFPGEDKKPSCSSFFDIPTSPGLFPFRLASTFSQGSLHLFCRLPMIGYICEADSEQPDCVVKTFSEGGLCESSVFLLSDCSELIIRFCCFTDLVERLHVLILFSLFALFISLFTFFAFSIDKVLFPPVALKLPYLFNFQTNVSFENRTFILVHVLITFYQILPPIVTLSLVD